LLDLYRTLFEDGFQVDFKRLTTITKLNINYGSVSIFRGLSPNPKVNRFPVRELEVIN
jgi:hypothetical protein